jgi:hypothetical protein
MLSKKKSKKKKKKHDSTLSCLLGVLVLVVPPLPPLVPPVARPGMLVHVHAGEGGLTNLCASFLLQLASGPWLRASGGSAGGSCCLGEDNRKG